MAKLNLTPKQLNSRIEKLFKKVKTDSYKIEMENEVKAELRDLIFEADDFESLTKNNILRLTRLNLRFRAVALHSFGLGINDEKLL